MTTGMPIMAITLITFSVANPVELLNIVMLNN